MLPIPAKELHALGYTDFNRDLDKAVEKMVAATQVPPHLVCWFQINSGCLAWIPYGTVPIITTRGTDPGVDLVIPWTSKALAENMEEPAEWAQVHAGLRAHYEKKKDEKPWSDVYGCVMAWLESCPPQGHTGDDAQPAPPPSDRPPAAEEEAATLPAAPPTEA